MEDKIIYNNDGEYGKYFMQELKLPPLYSDPEVMKRYARFGRRIHWLDSNNMPGSFQMNTSWYFAPTVNNSPDAPKTPFAMKPHVHDCDEVLGFYGSDPQDPYDLGGEVEIHINGEKHILTKSTLVYLPAGLVHLPLYVNKVDRPIFHFSIMMNSEYVARPPMPGEEKAE